MKHLVMIVAALCSMLQAAEEPISVALSGTVKDTAGTPLEGAKVTLAQMDSLSTETNASGEFTLENATGVLPPGNLKSEFGFSSSRCESCLICRCSQFEAHGQSSRTESCPLQSWRDAASCWPLGGSQKRSPLDDRKSGSARCGFLRGLCGAARSSRPGTARTS